MFIMKGQWKSVDKTVALEEGRRLEESESTTKNKSKLNRCKWPFYYVKLILYVELILFFGWGCYMIIQVHRSDLIEKEIADIIHERDLSTLGSQSALNSNAELSVILAKPEAILEKSNKLLKKIELILEQNLKENKAIDTNAQIHTSMQKSVVDIKEQSDDIVETDSPIIPFFEFLGLSGSLNNSASQEISLSDQLSPSEYYDGIGLNEDYSYDDSSLNQSVDLEYLWRIFFPGKPSLDFVSTETEKRNDLDVNVVTRSASDNIDNGKLILTSSDVSDNESESDEPLSKIIKNVNSTEKDLKMILRHPNNKADNLDSFKEEIELETQDDKESPTDTLIWYVLPARYANNLPVGHGPTRKILQNSMEKLLPDAVDTIDYVDFNGEDVLLIKDKNPDNKEITSLADSPNKIIAKDVPNHKTSNVILSDLPNITETDSSNNTENEQEVINNSNKKEIKHDITHVNHLINLDTTDNKWYLSSEILDKQQQKQENVMPSSEYIDKELFEMKLTSFIQEWDLYSQILDKQQQKQENIMPSPKKKHNDKVLLEMTLISFIEDKWHTLGNNGQKGDFLKLLDNYLDEFRSNVDKCSEVLRHEVDELNEFLRIVCNYLDNLPSYNSNYVYPDIQIVQTNGGWRWAEDNREQKLNKTTRQQGIDQNRQLLESIG